MMYSEINVRREADPETILEEMREKKARWANRERQMASRHYEINREASAFTVLLIGLGFLVLVIGLVTSLLSVAHGFVAAIAIWVLTAAIRSYSGRMVHDGVTGRETELPY